MAVTWVELSPVHTPDGHRWNTVYYPDFDEVVAWAVSTGQTWVYDGSDWTVKVATAGPPPDPTGISSVDQQEIGYHAPSGKCVMFFTLTTTFPFSGVTQTWTWDGTTWTQESPASHPLYSDLSQMAYHPGLGMTVMLVYTGAMQMYGWDGSDWNLLAPAHLPPATSRNPMAYDPDRAELVTVVGSSPPYDTWIYSGGDWALSGTLTYPTNPGNGTAGMVWDADLNQIVYAGVENPGAGGTVSTYAWTGTDWVDLAPVATPQGTYWPFQALAQDPATGGALQTGGRTETGGEGYIDATLLLTSITGLHIWQRF